jgi:hypothetical protein
MPGQTTVSAPCAALIQFQLALLDFYETQYAQDVWDEGRRDELLKSWVASLLPVLRAQRALNQQLLIAHRDLIGHYRDHLRSMLQSYGGHTP